MINFLFFFFFFYFYLTIYFFFFFQAEDGIRDIGVTGVQTCAIPLLHNHPRCLPQAARRRGWRAGAGRCRLVSGTTSRARRRERCVRRRPRGASRSRSPSSTTARSTSKRRRSPASRRSSPTATARR